VAIDTQTNKSRRLF